MSDLVTLLKLVAPLDKSLLIFLYVALYDPRNGHNCKLANCTCNLPSNFENILYSFLEHLQFLFLSALEQEGESGVIKV